LRFELLLRGVKMVVGVKPVLVSINMLSKLRMALEGVSMGMPSMFLVLMLGIESEAGRLGLGLVTWVEVVAVMLLVVDVSIMLVVSINGAGTT